MKGKPKPYKWMTYLILFVLMFQSVGLGMTRLVHAQEKETYTIITASDYAPFEFVDGDGDLVGIDVDIMNAIAENQGFEVEYRLMPFSSGLQALESNQADGMIAGMGITEERENAFDFSEPYYEAGSMFAARGDSNVSSLDDLRGKNVATKIGSAGAVLAEDMQDDYGFSVTTFEDSVNMYQDVISGNSDAVIEDYPVMAYAVNTGTIDLKLIGDEIDKTPFGFAVNKGQNTELIEKFNVGLAEIKASGEYDKILERYVGDNIEKVDNRFMGQLTENFPALMQGLGQTILLAFVSILIALLLGIVLGLMRAGRNNILSGIALVYIDLMRGLPLLVLAFFIYFGLPQMLGISYSAFLAGILTLGLNAAAYVAEIVRGGIQSIAKGQMEAGRSLGLSRATTMKRIVLPQAIKTMTPSLINQFVITLKDTSLLSVIGLVELTQTGRIVIARTYQSGAMWIIVGIIYVVIITVLTKLSNRIEKGL